MWGDTVGWGVLMQHLAAGRGWGRGDGAPPKILSRQGAPSAPSLGSKQDPGLHGKQRCLAGENTPSSSTSFSSEQCSPRGRALAAASSCWHLPSLFFNNHFIVTIAPILSSRPGWVWCLPPHVKASMLGKGKPLLWKLSWVWFCFACWVNQRSPAGW